MQDYVRKPVADIINVINKEIFLPDIQRDFIWKPEQVYRLFDSIMREYPISTMLFWEINGKYLQEEKIKKLEFVSRSKDKNRENTEINQSQKYLLVLDGQQRLTTFYLVLKGNYIIRNKTYDLYFNILSGDEEQEDGILYEFKFFNKDKGESFEERNNKKEVEKIWYRIKNIYDIKDLEDVSEILKDNFENKYSLSLSKEQRKSVSRLLRMLKYEKLIHYYPETEKGYDKVLDIFVRTNSGGTKLSYSDLLFSTIKSKWGDARDNFDSLLSNINDNERYDFSHDFILKTALVIYAKSNEEVRYKTKNFKSDLISNLKKDWKEIENAMTLGVDLFRDKLFLTSHKTIPSNNAVIPVIYWIFKNNKKGFGQAVNCITDTNINQIRLWLVKSLLSGIFGGQSDTILYKCKEAMDNNKSEQFPADDIEKKVNTETKKSMILDANILDKVKYNSPDSYLVLSLCYHGAINFRPNMKGNLPEQDHIFSQDELKKANIPKNKINSIFNIRYIGSGPNKIKSKTPFVEWMKSVGTNKDELKKHLIPEGRWSIDNFCDFLNKRKELIKNVLNMYKS